jgi:hypothetical protein
MLMLVIAATGFYLSFFFSFYQMALRMAHLYIYFPASVSASCNFSVMCFSIVMVAVAGSNKRPLEPRQWRSMFSPP